MSIGVPGPTNVPNLPPPGEDPYGVDVAIGPDGDLVVDSSGSLGLVGGVYDCAQAIFLRFKTAPGDVSMHPLYGSTVLSLIGSKQVGISAVMAQANADLTNLLAEDPRFSDATVNRASAPANPQYRDSVGLGISATLSGGESLTLASVSDPLPADVSLPQAVDPSLDPTLTYDATSEQEFFADQPEFDQLSDLNLIQSLVDDTPGASILGTGG